MILFGYIFFIFLGLIIGSFLNVVCYRAPIMMKREWKIQASEYLNQPISVEYERFNMCWPRSHCPHCKKTITAWQNIPLLSFLFMKGKCHHCKSCISWQYPLVELLAAFAAALCFWRFGYSWTFGCSLIFSWGLIAISVIDFNETFIPDSITYSLLWLGLLANAFHLFTSPKSAIIGAIIGYLFFWSIAKLFTLIRKKEGLGYGDFKLLAMLAAWLGVTSIINIVLLSSIVGLAVSSIFLISKKLTTSSEIPFGPFLAIAGWCTMLFGPFITNTILN